jgi:fructose-specific phosphotransferase system component IIB
MIKNAKIVNVIALSEGEAVTYFTLEGLEIGGFDGGRKIVLETQAEPSVPKGGVITSPNPKEVKRSKELQSQRDLTLEERVKYEQRKNS